MRSTIIVLPVWLFLTVFTSCQQNKESQRADDLEHNRFGNGSEADFGINQLENLIHTIEESDCYYGKGVGITGEPNGVYQAFEILTKNASDSLWLQLSYSHSSVMRLYAYDILSLNKQYEKQLTERYLNDTAVICIQTNDIQISCSIKQYITWKK